MSDTTRMLWTHALSPVHVGAGHGTGYVDRPIVREKVTEWPYLPSSAIKGVMAGHHGATKQARMNNEKLKAAFGTAGKESQAGAVVFTDAHLVCLPVRSLYGTFAWCTSPMALRRLKRDIQRTGGPTDLKVEPVGGQGAAVPIDGSALADGDGTVYLEDIDLTSSVEDWTKPWSELISTKVFPADVWQGEFQDRFAVLPDDIFNFLTQTGTEVNARVRLKQETKTVKKGGLWYEEHLPAETILAGLVWCDSVSNGAGVTEDALLEEFCSGQLQLQVGGNASTGKGQVRCRFADGGT